MAQGMDKDRVAREAADKKAAEAKKAAAAKQAGGKSMGAPGHSQGTGYSAKDSFKR